MKKYIFVLMFAGVLTACVTINIYFPAAAAQEAADQIIDDVWQINEDDAANASDTKPADTTTKAE